MLSPSPENRTDGTRAEKSAHYGAEQEKSKKDVVEIRRGRVRDKIRSRYIESCLSAEFSESRVSARLLLVNLGWNKVCDI